MADPISLGALRNAIRVSTLADETALAKTLLAEADIGAETRAKAQQEAAAFVKSARANASRSGLIDKFLQEYGLSTAEGVTLMRLAEALLRTPDAATADALIEDKIEAGDWRAHAGKSPFPLVNFSTRALMFTAGWLDDVEAKDPARKLVAATKSLLDRVGEPVIRASVAQAMKIMGEHFVLGETIEEAGKRGQTFKENGYFFSYDMLGEAAHTAADAEKYFNDYAEAIAAIAKNATSDRPAENPGISVKLSALHPRYEYGKKERVRSELGARTRELAIAAKDANIGFNIDAEEADRLDLSLDLIEALMRDPALDNWDGFGVVVQAYQRRATFVLDWLATLARETSRRIMVRLVKGAYWDGEIKRAQVMGLKTYPVFTRKVLTDVSFTACARKLLANTDVFYPQFATHNALTAVMVREMAGDYTDYELQRLHGMGEALHDSLIKEGVRSRIYAPVGGHRELLPYLVRRLLENGANSSFVNQLIDPDLSVDDVVADPVEEVLGLNVYPNPAINAPRDQFSGRRLAAKGWDETDPETAAHLEKVVSRRNGEAAKNQQVSGSEKTVSNPTYSNHQIGKIRFTTPHDVERACSKADAAQNQWAERTDRSDILFRTAAMLEERADIFMQLATQEAGKSIPDAIAEIREAVDFLRYYAVESETLQQEPLGVVACISPWNFPLAIFLGQVSAALAAGNAVVAKPAEQTSLIAVEAVRLLHDAGVPEEVLHLVPGDGPSVGGPLVANPTVKGVVFTGSTDTAKTINRSLIDAGKFDATLIAETGGINAMIVDSTALLEQAVTDVVNSAFQSAGQRCSACRLVCVQEDIADRFNEMLAGAMAELTIGDPAKLSTDVGPVIDKEALDNIEHHIKEMETSARLIARAREIENNVDGTFVRPIAFEIGAIRDLKREVFGPVLHVVRFNAKHLNTLIDEINDLGFGLTMGIHTRIDETMENIAARARIGNIYVNRNQIGAVVGVQPFGGEGLSGTGPKAGGPHYLSALTHRDRSNDQTGISVIDHEADIDIDALDNGYHAWSKAKDKAEIFSNAAKSLVGAERDCLENASEIFAANFATRFELPGPTGESNALRLRGRGVILCLGGDESFCDQLAKALAAGNLIIADTARIDRVGDAMKNSGADVIRTINLTDGTPRSLLLDERINAVAFDGSTAASESLARILADRDGAIIPLLSSHDAPHRYAVERTLTINTTAAGGDVRLLSLPE